MVVEPCGELFDEHLPDGARLVLVVGAEAHAHGPSAARRPLQRSSSDATNAATSRM